jgi:hypothetical protein
MFLLFYKSFFWQWCPWVVRDIGLSAPGTGLGALEISFSTKAKVGFPFLKPISSPALMINISNNFGFGPMAAKRRIRLDRNLFCEVT